MPDLTKAEADRLIQAYREDRPIDEICRRFGINKATLYKELEDAGVPLRAAGRGRKPLICEYCSPGMVEAGKDALNRYKHLDTEAAVLRIWGAMATALPKHTRKRRKVAEQLELGV